jgi:hypothetical protein
MKDALKTFRRPDVTPRRQESQFIERVARGERREKRRHRAGIIRTRQPR